MVLPTLELYLIIQHPKTSKFSKKEGLIFVINS